MDAPRTVIPEGLRAGRLDLAGGCPTAPEPTRRVESARPAEPVVASDQGRRRVWARELVTGSRPWNTARRHGTD